MTPPLAPQPNPPGQEFSTSILQEAPSEAILITDVQLRIQHANQEACDLLEITADQAPGMLLMDLMGRCLSAKALNVVQEAVRLQQSTYFDDFHAETGAWHVYRVYPTPLVVTIAVRAILAGQMPMSEPNDNRLLAVLQGMPQGVVVVDRETRKFLFANERMCQMLGYSGQEFLGLNAFTLHPVSEHERLGKAFSHMMEGKNAYISEVPLLRKDGSLLPADIHAIEFDLEGRPCICAVVVDISCQQQESQIQAARVGILEMLSNGTPLTDLLEVITLSIESIATGAVASVLLLEEDGVYIRQCIGPNLPDIFSKSIIGLPIGEKAGSCGTAMHRREPVFVEDIQTDPLWEDYRSLTDLIDLRACWSLPILGEKGQPLGSFALYYRQPLKPGPEEVALIQQAAHLTSLAISKSHREKKLSRERERANESEQLLKNAQRVAKVGNWEMDHVNHVLSWSDEVTEMVGFRPLPTDDPELVLTDTIHPDDFPRVRANFIHHLTTGEEYVSIHRIISPEGHIRFLQERCFTSFDPDGRPLRSVGVAADITDLKLAEEGLRKQFDELRRAKEALRESHQILELTLEGAVDAVVTINAKQEVIFVNRAALTMFGLEKGAVLGQNMAMLFPPDQARIHHEYVSHNLQTGAEPITGHDREFEITRPDGVKFWGHVTLSKIVNNGEVQYTAFIKDITDRKKAEDLLAENEIRLLQIAAHSRTISWEVDAQGMYTYISPVARQLLGYEVMEIVGKLHYYDLHPEARRQAFREAGERAFAEKKPFSNLENPIQCKSGEVIWVNTSGMPLLDADGTLLGYRGSDTDITQRKHAENESHLLRQAIATSTVGIVLADANQPEMPLVFVNEAFEQMTGYTAEEALGRNCRFLQGEDKTQPELESVRAAIRNGVSGTSVLLNYRKDGTAFWNQLTISPLFNQDDQLTHFLGIQQDVTVQKQAEQGLLEYAAELELRNAQLGTLLKSIPDAVWLKDPEGRYLKANAKFESFFGNKECELLGKTDYHFYPPDVAESFRENDQLAINEGKSRVNEEWVTGINGERELWEATKTPVIDSHGTLLGVLGVGHNITHRRLAETALRESEARYRIVADNTYNWEFWLAPDKRFVYHSPSCEIITGFSPEALKQDFGLFLNQIHPEDKDLYLHHHLHREAKDNRTEKIQFRIINREGQTRYIEHLCQAIFGEEGQYLGIRGTNVDVTDQKLAELALARSEQQFRTLFEGSPVSIIIHDKETGEIVDANPAAWQEYGLDSLEELQQQEFWLESPFAFSDALGLIQRAATEGAHTFEWKSGRKKGTDFWEQVHLRPLVINGIERVLATSFNISARKNAEESLWKLSYDLQERLKELSCLANISQLIETPDISVEELFQSAVELLPLSLQFPRRACASIQLDDRVFLSSNFLLSDYFLREELIVDNKRRGYVALYYSSDMPFLSEEDEMLKMIQRSLELYLANRQAQDSLIEEEERLRLAIAAANQGLYDLDLLTGDAVVSPEYARMLGYEPDEFTETNQAWLDRLHPDDLPVAKQTYIDYIEGLLPEYRMEFRQRHKNGGWVWILSLGKIQEWDDEGRPVRMLGTHTDITARKEAEAALATTASRYKDLFHLAPVGMVAATEDQEPRLFNKQFTDITGYSVEDIPTLEDWWQNAYPDPDYRKTVTEEWMHLVEESLLNSSAGKPMEVLIRCKNGESRYFEVGFMPGGAIHTMTFVDIHERKLAENALRRSEASYRELIEFSPVAKVVVDPNQKFSLMNNRFTELTGYTIEDAPDVDTLIGLSYPDENSRAEQSALKDWVIDQVMTQNRWTEPMESTITCKDGVRRTVEVGFVKIGGNFIATLVDVTQRRLAEDALRDSEARYRNILEQSPVGIAIHQGETLVFSNPAGLKLLGAKSEAELIGKSITSIMHPDFIAKNFEVLHRMVQGESGLFPIETRLIRLDGTAIEVEMSASLLSNNGEPTIQVIATDITERKRYTKAIEAQNKILKDINWTQSHVVRAPLATMMGLVSFLSQEDYSAFSYEDLLRLINEKANELDNIIRVISEKSYAISTLEGELSHPAPAQTVETASPQLEFLIVDDDPLIQKMQQAVIVKAGLHTQPSSFLNGRLALDHILQHDGSGKVFFVLLDINMPEMNGWEFLDAIQKQPLLARLEVVILTSSIDIADRIKAQKYPQVVEYMTKPINRLTVTELKDHPKLRSLWEGHS